MNAIPRIAAEYVENEIRTTCGGDRDLRDFIVHWLPELIASHAKKSYLFDNPYYCVRRGLQKLLNEDTVFPVYGVHATIKDKDGRARALSVLRTLVSDVNIVEFYAAPIVYLKLQSEMDGRLISAPPLAT